MLKLDLFAPISDLILDPESLQKYNEPNAATQAVAEACLSLVDSVLKVKILAEVVVEYGVLTPYQTDFWDAYVSLAKDKSLKGLSNACRIEAVIFIAIRQRTKEFRFVDPKLQNDHNFVISALKQNHRIFWYISSSLSDDEAIFQVYLQQRSEQFHQKFDQIFTMVHNNHVARFLLR